MSSLANGRPQEGNPREPGFDREPERYRQDRHYQDRVEETRMIGHEHGLPQTLEMFEAIHVDGTRRQSEEEPRPQTDESIGPRSFWAKAERRPHKGSGDEEESDDPRRECQAGGTTEVPSSVADPGSDSEARPLRDS